MKMRLIKSGISRKSLFAPSTKGKLKDISPNKLDAPANSKEYERFDLDQFLSNDIIKFITN